MWVQSLGQEDPLEEEMATQSRILPEESHGHRSPMGYSSQGRTESDTTEQLNNNNSNCVEEKNECIA